MDDESFARARVAGPNPGLIRRIERMPDNFPVRESHYQAALDDRGDSLGQALSSGRAYLLDYAELDAIQPGTWNNRRKYLSAPLALFARPRRGDSLVPIAIQCEQEGGPIFNRSSQPEARWAWQMAKTVVQAADGNYHELFAHLSRTHLVMEAVTVAMRRHLAGTPTGLIEDGVGARHPLFRLLFPHTRGTLFINANAAGNLIAPGGPIDRIFAGQLSSTQRATVQDRLAFDLLAARPKQSAKARGVEDLPDYPYRDDAALIWDAVHAWVSHYVGVYYKTEADVRGDYELQAWVTDLSGNGKLNNIGPIHTREALVELLAMVVFTASAQHAAVNFPQASQMTYAPFITGATWAPPPQAREGRSQQEWLAMLPPPHPIALEQISTLYPLGSLYFAMLWDDQFRYAKRFRDRRVHGGLQNLRASLRAAEQAIDHANRSRPVAYPYLKPSLIPASINI